MEYRGNFDKMKSQSLRTRVRRVPAIGTEWTVEWRTLCWQPDRTATIICDMWDRIQCQSAARRVAEMAPHMNRVIRPLRDSGSLIVHAPSMCMDFYENTPGRRRAMSAPLHTAPIPLDWQNWNPDSEAPLPMVTSDDEPCSCDAETPCCSLEPPHPWTRQIAAIEIAEPDAISDDGQEIFNLLNQHAIDLVIIMGVHANRCILGRPFGIRQLIYLGWPVILSRDLTDSYHREPGGHWAGTARIVEHIERYWCATVTSDQLVGGSTFRFRDAPDE